MFLSGLYAEGFPPHIKQSNPRLVQVKIRDSESGSLRYRKIQVRQFRGAIAMDDGRKVREAIIIYPLYTFIAVLTPMCTQYTYIYTIYTPNTPLNTLQTPSKHPIYALYTPYIHHIYTL